MKTYRITGSSLEQPWEGSLEELLEQNPELNEFVVQRLETMPVGDSVRPPVGPEEFTITRAS
jgi:hypothetical protein